MNHHVVIQTRNLGKTPPTLRTIVGFYICMNP
uniref:Uncharacterized protein n=1 Tax=Anguilla anguilla TaxID=7936 RepID=A0A0E9RGL6_ANGAN